MLKPIEDMTHEELCELSTFFEHFMDRLRGAWYDYREIVAGPNNSYVHTPHALVEHRWDQVLLVDTFRIGIRAIGAFHQWKGEDFVEVCIPDPATTNGTQVYRDFPLAYVLNDGWQEPLRAQLAKAVEEYYESTDMRYKREKAQKKSREKGRKLFWDACQDALSISPSQFIRNYNDGLYDDKLDDPVIDRLWSLSPLWSDRTNG